MLAQRLEAVLKTDEFQYIRKRFVLFFIRIITCILAFAKESSEIQDGLEFVRSVVTSTRKSIRYAFETQAIQACEKRLIQSQSLLEKMGATYMEESERCYKLEMQLIDEQCKFKLLLQQVDDLNKKLQESRALIKKLEKKTKQEDSKLTALVVENADLDEKLKNAKKEIEALKKKLNDDRLTARKQKERDLELIRCLENENFEKDAEKDRIRAVFEEKLKELRSQETKAQKDRKQAITNALERGRVAEAAQIGLMYRIHQIQFEKYSKEILSRISEAEASLKRPYNCRNDKDSIRRNLLEWKKTSEIVEKLVQNTKAEYDKAADMVLKGQIQFSQLNLSTPNLPELPKVVKPPTVQIVPPSATIHFPAIAKHPPGIIGQRQHRPVSEPASPTGKHYPVSFNPTEVDIITQPSSTLWNWPTPLEDVANVFRSSYNESSSKEHTWCSKGDFPTRDTCSTVKSSNWTHMTTPSNRHNLQYSSYYQ